MELLEKKLEELTRTKALFGLKIEFEAQGASLVEVEFLEKLAKKYNTNFSVKISGPEAIRDLKDIKNMNLYSIIAPLIESPYALKKFTQSVKKVFENDTPNLEINIESIVGFQNLDEIVKSDAFKELSGIKIGRSDLANSVGLNREFVNSNDVLAISSKISSKIESEGLDLTLGGGVSIETLDFAKKMPYLTKIETRNVVLKYTDDENLKKAINLALEFEILLIENKKNFGLTLNKNDLERIKLLNTR